MTAPATLTRREVAGLLNLHPDTITKQLVEGLGCAVTRWGGRGKPMIFSAEMVKRWDRARSCRCGAQGRSCKACALVLEDAQLVAEHLLETRHGYGKCRMCRADWPLQQPCSSPREVGK